MKSGSVLGFVALLAAAAPAHAERTMKAVDGTIRRHAPELKECYVREVEGEGASKASGKVIVELTIQTDGVPERVRIGKRSTLRHAGLERCVLGVFRAMRFGPDDQPTEISYPLLYQSE